MWRKCFVSSKRGNYEREKVIVSLKGISKTYDNDVKVVKNIDLDIYEGEFLTILGASGCGKTTTLRMIAGFEDVSSGDICIDGSSVIGVPPYKRQVNTAFQSYALFPHLSVYDNIAYGLKVKKVSKAEIHERVSHMLSLIRLDGYEKGNLLSFQADKNSVYLLQEHSSIIQRYCCLTNHWGLLTLISESRCSWN